MTPQDLMQFFTTRRSYRRFRREPVPAAALEDLLQAAAWPPAPPTARR